MGRRDPKIGPPNVLAHKARPLDGIWATAPYLHNGSVPNLYNLLLPAHQRVTQFNVAHRDFDPVAVGLVTDPHPDGFEFRVKGKEGKPIPGNANSDYTGKGYTETFDDGIMARLYAGRTVGFGGIHENAALTASETISQCIDPDSAKLSSI